MPSKRDDYTDGTMQWVMSVTIMPDRDDATVCVHGIRWMRGVPHSQHLEWVKVWLGGLDQSPEAAFEVLHCAAGQLVNR